VLSNDYCGNASTHGEHRHSLPRLKRLGLRNLEDLLDQPSKVLYGDEPYL